jgi:hypothetical protein
MKTAAINILNQHDKIRNYEILSTLDEDLYGLLQKAHHLPPISMLESKVYQKKFLIYSKKNQNLSQISTLQNRYIILSLLTFLIFSKLIHITILQLNIPNM